MALERTFSIVKPDAVAKNHIGAIYNRFETAGLKIVAATFSSFLRASISSCLSRTSSASKLLLLLM